MSAVNVVSPEGCTAAEIKKKWFDVEMALKIRSCHGKVIDDCNRRRESRAGYCHRDGGQNMCHNRRCGCGNFTNLHVKIQPKCLTITNNTPIN